MTNENELYRLTWDEAAGVAHVYWLPHAVCRIEEARAVDAEIKALGRGKVLLVVDLRDIASIDRPAREFFIDQNSNYGAVALVAGSPATRMLANFFMGLKRGTIPVRMFSSETDAVAWLQEQA